MLVLFLKYLGGWFVFVLFLVVIGFMIVIIGDFVILFGCFVNLDDSIIVIIFVVLGISMLDMFVSK